MAVEQAKEAALSIKPRAGTFGFDMASQVSRLLYLFLCTDFRPDSKTHLAIYRKHVDSIQVMIADKIQGTHHVGQELVAELKRLVTLHVA